MRRFLQKVRSFVIELIRLLLSCMIPVKKGKVFFESVPDYSDNSRAFSDYILKHTNYCVLWSVKNANKYQSNDRIRFIEKNGGTSIWGRLSFIYHTVSSQYLFSTHCSFLYANRYRQKYICLWHGAPLKKIAVLQDPSNKYYLNNATGILCSSQYYVSVMARCFGWNDERVLPLGIPRNDWLFQNTRALERLGVVMNNNEKVITYLPTFRKTEMSEAGDSKLNLFTSGLFDFESKEKLGELNEYMRSLNLFLIVKPHPADVNQLDYITLSNVAIVPQKYFTEKDVQLNQLLHESDALITDFSGVYIDYINLDRPIGFYLTDLDDYTNTRGFLFDNPLDVMPGVKLYTEEDLKTFCEDISKGVDTSKEERARLRSMYNDYSDGNNCKRLADYLGFAKN